MGHLFGADVGVTADGIVTVDFSGELDLSCAGAIYDLLVAAGSGGRSVRLSLDQVTFIDAAAVMQLVRCGDELAAAGGRLQIGAVSYPVRRVLDVLGLSTGSEGLDVDREA